MTPSPSTPTLPRHVPGVADGPPTGGAGPDLRSDLGRGSTLDHLFSIPVDVIAVWFLATCHRCGPDLAQPFRDLVERDEWAVKHAEATGHVVHLGVDGEAATLHHALLLRYFEHGAAWRWMCPAHGCSTWLGPYESGQLALAAWRSHEATR